MATHSSSYTDFWKLVELAGFEIVHPEQINFDSYTTYIVSPVNGEYQPSFPSPRKARIIHWNLERPTTAQYDMRFDQTWVSDLHLQSIMPDSRYVTLGTDKRLADYKPWPHEMSPHWYQFSREKKFDLIHLSCPSGHRDRILGRLNGSKIAPSGWGLARHKALLQSKVMLATHQDTNLYIEPLRYALAVAYDLPILAEHSTDFHPFEVTTGEPIPGLPELKWIRLKDGVEYDFMKCVEAAVEDHK